MAPLRSSIGIHFEILLSKNKTCTSKMLQVGAILPLVSCVKKLSPNKILLATAVP